ncbi:unnamed protein product [Schistosoma mattheei]|uniref:Uncharacterized protein n=1 Tax=Schistosoma mattheei TaxID=31246 RepID=A0A183PCD2_9TREM|nr:unnamed protein product [Schistosoma mattheei]
MAIRQIKSGKSELPDNIPAQALTSNIGVIVKILRVLFRNTREEEQVPLTDWKEGYLNKIPKKGDLSNCEKPTTEASHYYRRQENFSTE